MPGLRHRIGAAALGVTAACTVLTAAPAAADPRGTSGAASGFAAQAHRAGLGPQEVEALQRKVDGYLAKVPDSRQTGPNTVAFPGGHVTVGVPGEKHPRDLRDPLRSFADCGTALCGWENSDRTTVYVWEGCWKHDVRHLSGPGVWWNAQRGQMRAHMYGAQGNRIYTTPNAYSEDLTANWSPVYWLKPCVAPR